MLGGPLRCLDTVCCRWPAALIDAQLITALALSGMLNGSYPGLPQPLYVGLFAPLQKAYSVVMQDGVVMQDYTRKTRTGITKKLFSFVKANAKAAWHSVGIQRPPDPPPSQN